MIVLKIALRNLVRRPRRTGLLFALGLVGTMMIFFTEAVFAGTERGLHTSYAGSLTGDFVIAQESANTTSIFGNDMPLIGEYFIPPQISFYRDLAETLDATDGIAWSPIVSTAARVECGDFRDNMQIVGINDENYFKICRNIDMKNVNLAMLDAGKRGISFPLAMKVEIEEELGRVPEIGDEILVTFAVSGIFSIEKAAFAGFHEYVNADSPFDRIALADPVIPRQLILFSIESESVQSTDALNDDNDDIAAMFFEGDVEEADENKSAALLEEFEADLNVQESVELKAEADSDAWNFVLVSAPKNAKSVMRGLKKSFDERGLSLKTLDWKMAAGLPSQSAFAMQAIFSCGVIFVLFAAILVITNGLTISVLERVSEIGTMRAIGARRSFVAILFFAETLILVMSAVFFGIAASLVLCRVVAAKRIILNSELLQTIFGGRYLVPVASLRLVLLHIVFGVAISACAWVYPVAITTRISPVQVMGRK